MDDTEWIEQVCRALCRNKGFDQENWASERPNVIEVMNAIKTTGAVVLPIIGEVE